jgi:hypothetical protein
MYDYFQIIASDFRFFSIVRLLCHTAQGNKSVAQGNKFTDQGITKSILMLYDTIAEICLFLYKL